MKVKNKESESGKRKKDTERKKKAKINYIYTDKKINRKIQTDRHRDSANYIKINNIR